MLLLKGGARPNSLPIKLPKTDERCSFIGSLERAAAGNVLETTPVWLQQKRKGIP